MEDYQKILDYLDKTNKKIDRLTTMVTKIAKTLHLIPVTEKEERDIQIAQRDNLNLAAKVSADLDEMSPKPEGQGDEFLQNLHRFDMNDIFSDVIADDYLGG